MKTWIEAQKKGVCVEGALERVRAYEKYFNRMC